jgi:hypothetical protein
MLACISTLKGRVLFGLAVLLLLLGLWELLPGTRLRAKQAALIEWAKSGQAGDFRTEFAAANYQDQWGHTAADVVEKVKVARYAFPGLTITEGEPEFDRDGGAASVRQSIDLRGVDEPRSAVFTFRWKRESWTPWSWRLESVAAPGLEF